MAGRTTLAPTSTIISGLAKRLNVQLGLRWEPYLPEREKFNRMQHFDEAAFIAGTHTSTICQRSSGLIFPRRSGDAEWLHFPEILGSLNLGWGWLGTRPVVGVRPFARALAFSTTPGKPAHQEDSTADAPWGDFISLPSPAGGLTNPYAGIPRKQPVPVTFPTHEESIFSAGGPIP